MDLLGGVEHGCVDGEVPACFGLIILFHGMQDPALKHDDQGHDEADEWNHQAGPHGVLGKAKESGHVTVG
jgi:hypothetical protein